MLLVNAPVAATGPSVVLLSAVVGLAESPQTTPCSVGLGMPRLVMLPLPVAVTVPTLVAAWVVTVGCVYCPNVAVTVVLPEIVAFSLTTFADQPAKPQPA